MRDALAHWQRAFGAAIDGAATLPALRGDAATVARRFGVYRNNVRLARMAALRNAYPVIAALVGDAFFDGLARRFASTYASTAGDLNAYGAAFDAFLAAFEPAQALPYLPDVARLERAVHVAWSAADSAPFDVARLASLDAAAQAALRFTVRPGAHALVSRWPIAAIWNAHQPDAPHGFDFDAASPPYFALVRRDATRVRVDTLDAAAHALFVASAGGAPLADALDAVVAAAPHADAGVVLGTALRDGWFDDAPAG
ncbi:MAG: DNA-binding domain-containing protein [Burkholderiales bacterium]|jgi:hypothetical protein|nr:DNA-binding domain-containing protein [Burkholderiales bacterium]